MPTRKTMPLPSRALRTPLRESLSILERAQRPMSTNNGGVCLLEPSAYSVIVDGILSFSDEKTQLALWGTHLALYSLVSSQLYSTVVHFCGASGPRAGRRFPELQDRLKNPASALQDRADLIARYTRIIDVNTKCAFAVADETLEHAMANPHRRPVALRLWHLVDLNAFYTQPTTVIFKASCVNTFNENWFGTVGFLNRSVPDGIKRIVLNLHYEWPAQLLASAIELESLPLSVKEVVFHFKKVGEGQRPRYMLAREPRGVPFGVINSDSDDSDEESTDDFDSDDGTTSDGTIDLDGHGDGDELSELSTASSEPAGKPAGTEEDNSTGVSKSDSSTTFETAIEDNSSDWTTETDSDEDSDSDLASSENDRDADSDSDDEEGALPICEFIKPLTTTSPIPKLSDPSLHLHLVYYPTPRGDNLFEGIAKMYAKTLTKRKSRALKMTLVGIDEFDAARDEDAAGDDAFGDIIDDLPWGPGGAPPREHWAHPIGFQPIATTFLDSLAELVPPAKAARVRRDVCLLSSADYVAQLNAQRRKEEDWWPQEEELGKIAC